MPWQSTSVPGVAMPMQTAGVVPDPSVGDAYKESLVQRVKDHQRLGPAQKEQWHSYCDTRLGGIRDPNRHNVGALEDFLISSGSVGPAGAVAAAPRVAGVESLDPIKDKLVQEVKTFQRTGHSAREAWQNYADQNLGGSRDPARHDAVTLRHFLKQHGPGAGDLLKDQLVQQVKAWQRQSAEQKEIWHTYADTQLGGVRDPARHDTATLQGFARTYALPSLAPDPAPPPRPGSGDPVKDKLVQQVKAYQRKGQTEKDTWHNHADAQLGGIRDPARHDAQALQDFLVTHDIGLLSGLSEPPAKRMKDSGGAALGTALADPMKQNLVMQIKAFQRASPQQKEQWHEYADAQLGGVRDPARHDATALEDFIATHGVPPVAPSAAPAKDVLQEPLAILQRAFQAPSPAQQDPTQQNLVQQIKSYQRANQLNKDTWHQYADEHLGGVRDPARHGATVLEDFIAAHGVPPVVAAATQSDPLKDQLVAAVKTYQSASKEQKDMWHDYADANLGGTRDPARHDAASLQAFFSSIQA